MMKLGIQHVSLGVDIEEMYQKFSEAGFQSIDYSLMNKYTDSIWQLSDEELKKEMESVKLRMEKYGLFTGQTHAPMDAYWHGDVSTKEARLHAQIQAIKATSYLESPYIVIHPIMFPYRMDKEKYEQAKAVNIEFFKYLEPYAKEFGVKIAIENFYAYDPILKCYCESSCSSAEHLMDYIETLNSDCFVACLDVGHARVAGQNPVNMIYQLGDYLKVLHIQDIDGIDDQHMMPGLGILDWNGIGKALNDVKYDGVFSFECNKPFGLLGSYRFRLADKLLKVYAELGKAIVGKRHD